MRIRRCPLPFPTLVSSPLLLSDPSIPKTQSIKKTSSSVKVQNRVEEKRLHQSGDLHHSDPTRLGASSSNGDAKILHPFSPQKFEVLKEEKSFECKRISTPTSSTDDSYTMAKEEKLKDKKKTKRGQAAAMIMEGSRCSRINGRGWRCAQPTLVGYSLCEHHLGKGRSKGSSIAARGPLGCTEHKRRALGEGSSHEIFVPRRKNKARSISSLLDEKNGDHQLIPSGMQNGEGM